MTDKKQKLLLVWALPREVVPVSLPGWDVVQVVTGVGKARAALMTMRALMEHRPQAVLNVGTAGAFSLEVGDIAVCLRFWERDFARCALPGVDYELRSAGVPFQACLPSVLQGRTTQRECTVSTGDDFVTEGDAGHADVVDMEAFAVWQACREMDVPMAAVKCVTDVGRNSVADWQDRLAGARMSLTAYFTDVARRMQEALDKKNAPDGAR